MSQEQVIDIEAAAMNNFMDNWPIVYWQREFYELIVVLGNFLTS